MSSMVTTASDPVEQPGLRHVHINVAYQDLNSNLAWQFGELLWHVCRTLKLTARFKLHYNNFRQIFLPMDCRSKLYGLFGEFIISAGIIIH